MKQRYDEIANDPDFEIGDYVYVYNPHCKPGHSRKFLHPWQGPYHVIERMSPVNYKLRLLQHRSKPPIVVHANRMKHCWLYEKAIQSEKNQNKTGVRPDTNGGTPDPRADSQCNGATNDQPNVSPDDTNDDVTSVHENDTNSDTESNHKDDEETDDDVYPVEKIVKTKTQKGKKYYLIKWKDYSDKYNSWIPEDVGLPLIEEYKKGRQNRTKYM